MKSCYHKYQKYHKACDFFEMFMYVGDGIERVEEIDILCEQDPMFLKKRPTYCITCKFR